MSSASSSVQDASVTTYVDRLQRAQGEMARQGIDLLLVGPSADLFYLIGNYGHESERLSLLVLPREGVPHYVTAALEAPLLAAQRDLLEIVTWEETDDPAAKVAQVAGTAGEGTVAVSDVLWSLFTIRLQRAMPRSRWTEGGPLLRPLRMIKDDNELDRLADAAHRTDESWEEFITTSLSRLTELEVRDRLMSLLAARGVTPTFCVVGSGPNSASPHHVSGDRVVTAGDAI